MKKAGKNWISVDFGTPNPPKKVDFGFETKPFNLLQKLEPTSVSDLAVHPKKIQEVEHWLQNNVHNPNKRFASMLLVSGPTGSGKTATVNVLCKTLDISVSEWVTPTDQNTEFYSGGQSVKFWEFLSEAKYPSLFESSNKKVMLVEDFPNSVIRNPKEFFEILEKCYCVKKLSVVFICADANNTNLNLSQTLFPQEVREKFKISHVSFNPCSATLLKNALKRAHFEVQKHLDVLKSPLPNIVDAIICSSAGDVRCAVNQYYFACLKGISDLPIDITKFEKAGTKRKRIASKTATVKSMSKDETLGLFHSLGRVLNPKRKEEGSSWRLQCDLETLIDEFSTQPGTFSGFLFENYLKYFGDLGDVCGAAEFLSLSQVFLEKWTDRHDTLVFALWISVLGVMVCNGHKVSQWNQIRGPVKVGKRVNDSLEMRNVNPMDFSYYNCISKTNSYPSLKVKQ